MFRSCKVVIYVQFFIVGFFLFTSPFVFGRNNNNFVVVIDPGHGGRDPGALGKISKEKDINLGVALKLGELIQRDHKSVDIIFTRDTDKYLDLQERADIANKASADLFISIHTNAVKNTKVYGAETYTLGLAKSQANLEVAMRENSVMLLEEDHKTKYKGFDPSSVESYIMFEFMQDKYIDQSLEFASSIQYQLTNHCSRYDRGVRQAGFWVLHRTAAPSVLIELGFISNVEEEKFLKSENGQKKMATAIFNAFNSYKKSYDLKSGNVSYIASNPNIQESNKPVYKLQLFGVKDKLTDTRAFADLKDFSYYYEDKLYKYTIGNETDYSKIQQLKDEMSDRFPGLFVVAFVGDKKISVTEALNLSN